MARTECTFKAGDSVRVKEGVKCPDAKRFSLSGCQGEECVFPLGDLTAVDRKSPNHRPVRDYAVWYANR